MNLSGLFVIASIVVILLLSLKLLNRFLKRDRVDLQKFGQDDAIIISGCDSGIGLEIAKHFHRIGTFKIICCFFDMNESSGFLELQHINTDGRLLMVKLDVTSENDINRIVTKIKTWQDEGIFKRLVALINNAGTMTYGEFDWLTWNQIQRQIDVNMTGTFRFTRAILSFIIESKGRIINVSSVNDFTVFPGLSIYSATKAALSAFSRGLGYELRKFGINVITIRLGDFAKLTNIMSKHSSYRDDMWDEMSAEKKALYKDFFDEFNSYLLKNYGMTSPKQYQDSPLFNDFTIALLARDPPKVIVCAPVTFKVFYFLMELTPVKVYYHLLDLMFHFAFRWKSPPLASSDRDSHLGTCK